MATMTLLELVQDILSDMDSDEVNSVSDTVESLQVAGVIKSTYYQIIANRDIPELKELTQLTALADASLPNYLKLPDGVTAVEWVKYNTKLSGATDEDFTDIKQLSTEEFALRSYKRNSGDTNVVSITDISGVPLFIIDDKAPEWWTSFDDLHLVFDSYDSAVDSTLQASKSIAYVQTSPTWTVADTFTPDLDDTLFPFLLAEAKATCFVALKQTTNRKVEQQSRGQQVRMQNAKHRFKTDPISTDFGRRRRS